MIKKDKNKLKLETKSKILVLGLILIILVGLFSPMMQVNAEDLGTCTFVQQGGRFNGQTFTRTETRATCEGRVPPEKWTSVNAQGTSVNPNAQQIQKNSNYQLLAPLPGTDSSNPMKDVNTEKGFGSYLNLMIKIFIGLCAVLSVVMIVIGGLEYMTSELISSKEAGKEKVTGALLGLLIALGAYALLFTINPDLLKSDINPPDATVTTPTAIVKPAVTTPSLQPVVTPLKTTVTPTAPLGTCTYITYNGGENLKPITVTVTETEAQCTAGNIGIWEVIP